MLDAKITLTRHLVDTIKKGRIDNNIKAADLSESIGRTVSYISSVENGRIAKIATKDLIAIFMNIFSISEEDSILKIQEIINGSTSSKENNIDFDDSDDDSITNEIDTEKAIVTYKDLDAFVNSTDFNKMLKSISKAFMAYYKHNSKDAFLTANNLVGSLNSDLGFTMVLLSLPYARLNDLSHGEKQKILDDLIEFFKPYFDEPTKKTE